MSVEWKIGDNFVEEIQKLDENSTIEEIEKYLLYDFKRESPIFADKDFCREMKEVIESKTIDKRELKEGFFDYAEVTESKLENAIKNFWKYKIPTHKWGYIKQETIKKMQDKKLISPDSKNKFDFDCDIVLSVKKALANLISKNLAESIKDKKGRIIKFKNNDEIILLETDTMNSVSTTLNRFIREYLKKYYNKSWYELYTSKCNNNGLTNGYKEDTKENTKKDTKKDTLDYFRDSWILENYDEIIKKANEKEKDIFRKFNEFAYLYHTIGNFILVPEGYNVGRYDKTKDYWDLTLVDLKGIAYNKKWYDDTKKWYTSNINLFLLDDYFENYNKELDFTQLELKELFRGHKFNKIIPKTIKEYDEFLTNVNRLIIKRGIRILKKLNSNIEKIEEFKEENLEETAKDIEEKFFGI